MGGTMLATHHDCGAPLFRYKGEVVCPVCSFEEAGAPQVKIQQKNFETEPGRKPPGKSRSSSTVEEEEVLTADFGVRRAIEETPPPEGKDDGEIAHREGVSGKRGSKDETDLALEELHRTIIQKIREISEKMRDEQDLGRLKSQLEYVKEALKVLGRLRD